MVSSSDKFAVTHDWLESKRKWVNINSSYWVIKSDTAALLVYRQTPRPHPDCLSVFTMSQLAPSEAKPFIRGSTPPLCSQRARALLWKEQITHFNLKKHGDALVLGASVQRLAPPDCSLQSGHHERAAEKRRSRKPVWLFCCLPPAAESCQKEPVSDMFNTYFIKCWVNFKNSV